MANEIIQSGNKIELRPVQRWDEHPENAPIQPYVSQFMEWVDHNVAVILVPFHQGQLLQVRVDEVYELCFYTKSC